MPLKAHSNEEHDLESDNNDNEEDLGFTNEEEMSVKQLQRCLYCLGWVNTSSQHCKEFDTDDKEGKEAKAPSAYLKIVNDGYVAVQPGYAVQRGNKLLCLLKSMPPANKSPSSRC